MSLGNWFVLIDFLIESELAPVLSVYVQGQEDFISQLNIVMVDETETFLLKDQINDYMERVSDEIQFCKDKAEISGFDIYTINDFYTLWYIYTCFIVLSAGSKSIFLLLNAFRLRYNEDVYDFCRQKANKHIIKGGKTTFSIWTSFSISFIEMNNVLRRKKVLKNLQKIRARLHSDNNLEVAYIKTIELYGGNSDLRQLDKSHNQIPRVKEIASHPSRTMLEKLEKKDSITLQKFQEVSFDDPSQFQSSPQGSPAQKPCPISKATLKRKKILKRNLKEYKKWLFYFYYSEFFFKNFVARAFECFLFHSKGHFYSEMPPMIEKVRWGQTRRYYTIKHKNKEKVDTSLAFRQKLWRILRGAFATKINQKQKIRSEYFKAARKSYSEKTKFVLITSFSINEGIIRIFKAENPDYEETIKNKLAQRGSCIKLISQLFEDFSKKTSKIIKKHKIHEYKKVKKMMTRHQTIRHSSPPRSPNLPRRECIEKEAHMFELGRSIRTKHKDF